MTPDRWAAQMEAKQEAAIEALADEVRTYYGDPAEPVEELLGFREHGAPRDGDELCDGHQMHYEWSEGKWQ